MKAEINNENKARFFDLYSGQKVIQVRTYSDLKTPYGCKLVNDFRDRKLGSIALLKPLSSISDDDAIEVANIYGLNGFSIRAISQFGVKDFGSKNGEITLFNDLSFGGNSSSSFEADYFKKNIVFDYLRSKGYALPWMGLSVDQMIEAEWIKLIES